MIVSICQQVCLRGWRSKCGNLPLFIPGCVISHNCWKGRIGHGMSDRMCWESSPIGLWHLRWSWSSHNTTGLDLLTEWDLGWPSEGEGPAERAFQDGGLGHRKGQSLCLWPIDKLCLSWGTYDCVIFPRSCRSMERANGYNLVPNWWVWIQKDKRL